MRWAAVFRYSTCVPLAAGWALSLLPRATIEALAPEPSMDSLVSMRRTVCNASRELLVAKSSAVTVGFMIKSAISLTVESFLDGEVLTLTSESSSAGVGGVNLKANSTGIGDEVGDQIPDPAATALPRVTKFGVDVGIFSLELLAIVWLKLGVARVPDDRLPERLKRIYESGLGLIPAWAWKDVVADFTVLFTTAKSHYVGEAPSLASATLALLVAFLSAALHIFLESRLRDVESSQETIFYKCMRTLRSSLGLGCGFVVNQGFNSVVGNSLSNVWVKFAYAFVLSVAFFFAQSLVYKMLEARKEFWSPLRIRTVEFLFVAGGFVLGWAWKSFLDAALQPLASQGLAWQLTLSLLITLFGVVVVAGVTAASATSGAVTLCTLIAAMNIGWTWMDFTAAMSRRSSFAQSFPWLFCLAVIAAVTAVGFALEMAIRAVERAPEMQPLV